MDPVTGVAWAPKMTNLVPFPNSKSRIRPLPSRTFARVLLILGVLTFLRQTVHAEDIRIRVLNGRNGKPVTNECLNVWMPSSMGAHIVAGTNKEGVVVLHLAANEFATDIACADWPIRSSRPSGADAITLLSDSHVACQEYGKIAPGEPQIDPLTRVPSYPIRKILESGISAANTCGKFRAEAKPGELVFYVRPLSFLERWRL